MLLPEYLIYAVVACVFFGVGGAMQKHGVASALPKITLKQFLAQPLRIVRTVLTNWVWVVGVAFNLLGGLFFLGALGAGQLSVVQPLVSTNAMVSLLIGVTLFSERMNRSEWVSLALFLAGGAVLASSAGNALAIDGPYNRGLLWVAIAVFTATASIPLILMRRKNNRMTPEIGLAIAAGIFFGLGSVSIKAISLDLTAALGGIDPLSPALWWAVLTSPHAWLIAVWNVLGFLCFQGAFAHGRVSVVAAVTNVMVMVAPVLIGTFLFHEPMTAMRVAGILAVAIGTALLSLAKKEDPPQVERAET